MEVSVLKHAGPVGIHGRSPLLRLQSDERLVAMTRRGNQHAFEALVARYQARLLAFCRHMLSSREDAEDVLQEVFAASFNAMVADERPINVRPWLYRIARNRSLNHLRRTQAIGVDSMDVHFSDHGLTTADKVHGREEFRNLIEDVQQLPETQKTALLLREIDALSYEQIAEAMETTVPSVKSLLVRARVSLAEAAEARLLTCDEVRLELGEVAEGLTKTTAPVRRHLRTCDRCQTFRKQLRQTNKALAAVFPIGPLFLLKKLLLTHLGTSAASSGSAAAGGAAASSAGAVAAGGALQAGVSAVATKAAAGLAAAAIVTAGAVEVQTPRGKAAVAKKSSAPAVIAAVAPADAPVAVASEAQEPAVSPEVAPEDVTPAKEPKAAATPAATPGAAPTPAATPGAVTVLSPVVQHDGDTTTLSTGYTGAATGQDGSLPPQATQPQPSPTATAEPTPSGNGGQQPTAAPAEDPGAEPTPQPTSAEPTPEPTPDSSDRGSEPGGPTATPSPTPEPGA